MCVLPPAIGRDPSHRSLFGRLPPLTVRQVTPLTVEGLRPAGARARPQPGRSAPLCKNCSRIHTPVGFLLRSDHGLSQQSPCSDQGLCLAPSLLRPWVYLNTHAPTECRPDPVACARDRSTIDPCCSRTHPASSGAPRTRRSTALQPRAGLQPRLQGDRLAARNG